MEELNRAVGRILGEDGLCLTWADYMDPFWRVWDMPGLKPVDTMAREHTFWRKMYQTLLEERGVAGDLEGAAADLYERFPYFRLMEPFPETVRVLEALKARGYRLGVISDCFPSLERTLQAMGIAGYFESFTASSLVGAMKPDPRIFRAATESLAVCPEESVFVDDTKIESDGAREEGFTAFHLDRTREAPDFANWELGNLDHLIAYLDSAESGALQHG